MATVTTTHISLVLKEAKLFFEKLILGYAAMTMLMSDHTKSFLSLLKDKDYCQIEIIKGLTDKGQFQYLTKLMGPQEGTYLYATQFHSLR